MDQQNHGDDEKTREPQFWDLAQWPTAIIRPKSQNSNIRHDGILSIGNFMLMINNHFTLFQLSKLVTSQKQKKMCSLFPWQHVISYLSENLGDLKKKTEKILKNIAKTQKPKNQAF
jgi:hypothetical protein